MEKRISGKNKKCRDRSGRSYEKREKKFHEGIGLNNQNGRENFYK